MQKALINEIVSELQKSKAIETKPTDADLFRDTHNLADDMVSVTCKRFLKPTDVAGLRTELVKQFAHLIQVTEYLFKDGGEQ